MGPFVGALHQRLPAEARPLLAGGEEPLGLSVQGLQQLQRSSGEVHVQPSVLWPSGRIVCFLPDARVYSKF